MNSTQSERIVYVMLAMLWYFDHKYIAFGIVLFFVVSYFLRALNEAVEERGVKRRAEHSANKD